MIHTVICFAVIGNRRSGTSHLNNLLRSHPEVSSVVEPFTLNIADFRRLELYEWNQADYDNSIYHPVFSQKPYVRNYIRELREWLLNPAGTANGFKEVTLQTKIPWLKSFVPGIKIIYIAGDPKNVVASHVMRNFAKRWDYRGIFEDYLNTHSNAVQLISPYSKEEVLSDEILLTSYLWKINTRSVLNARRRIEMLTLRTVDLTLESETVLNTVMNYVGLEVDRKQISYLREHCRVPEIVNLIQ